MIEPKMELSKYGELLECTPEEIKRLREYSRNDYKYINAILTNNDGLIEQTPDLKPRFSRNSGGRITPEAYAMFIQSAMEAIPKVYSAMLKDNIKKQSNKRSRVLYRGTSEAEAKSLNIGDLNAKFTSATEDGSGWQKFAYAHHENACEIRIVIEPGSNVLTITPEYMLEGDVLPNEDEVLIGPFTRVVDKQKPASQSKNMTSYVIKLEQAQLESLPKEQQETLEKQIEAGLQVDANGHSKIYDAISLLVNGEQDIEGNNDSISYFRGKIEKANDLGDIEDYNAKIKKYEAEIEKLKTGMEEAKLALSEWKNAIIKLSMAKCYDVEHQLAVDMQRCEEKDVQQQDNTIHSNKSQLNTLFNNLGKVLLPGSPEQREQTGRISQESRRLHEKINQLNNGRYYNDSVNTCLMLINSKIIPNCQRINSQIKNSQDPAKVTTMVEALKNSSYGLGISDYSQIQAVMQQSVVGDENLLKKLVFEKFCEVAIETEVASIREKATEKREEADKKTFLGIGKDKKEVARDEASRLEKFVGCFSPLPEKEEYTGQKYSVRDIVAEMELFVEEQDKSREADGRLTPRSQHAIEEVKRLRDILFSEFKVPNKEIQIARAKEAIRMQEAGKGDEHIARVERLYGKMEKRGIPSNRLLDRVNNNLTRMNMEFDHIGLNDREINYEASR